MVVVVRKDWLEERMEDERRDSETYWRKYVETGDETYKRLSLEEMGHAEVLCALRHGSSPDGKTV